VSRLSILIIINIIICHATKPGIPPHDHTTYRHPAAYILSSIAGPSLVLLSSRNNSALSSPFLVHTVTLRLCCYFIIADCLTAFIAANDCPAAASTLPDYSTAPAVKNYTAAISAVAKLLIASILIT
jgi:hypothetical protein